MASHTERSSRDFEGLLRSVLGDKPDPGMVNFMKMMMRNMSNEKYNVFERLVSKVSAMKNDQDKHEAMQEIMRAYLEGGW